MALPETLKERREGCHCLWPQGGRLSPKTVWMPAAASPAVNLAFLTCLHHPERAAPHSHHLFISYPQWDSRLVQCPVRCSPVNAGAALQHLRSEKSPPHPPGLAHWLYSQYWVLVVGRKQSPREVTEKSFKKESTFSSYKSTSLC